MSWWYWCLFGLILLLAELLSPGGFYLMFFGLGAMITGMLTLLLPAAPQWVQWIVFPIFSVVLVAAFRHRVLKRFSSGSKADVDSIIGERASALESINAGSLGMVQMRGSAWRARNSGTRTIQNGEECEVEQLDGLVLIVRGH